MAGKKANKPSSKKTGIPKFQLGKQPQVILGVFFMILGLALTISFISYFFTWQADQSILSQFTDREEQAQNLLNKFGAWVSDFFVYKGFGVSALIVSILIFISGLYLFFSLSKKPLKRHWFWGILIMIWLSVFFGFFASKSALLGGVIGFEMNHFLQDYLGFIGTVLFMSFLFLAYIISKFKLTPDKIITFFKQKKQKLQEDFASAKSETEIEIKNEEIPLQETKIEDKTTPEPEPPKEKEKIVIKPENENDLSLEVEQAEDEEEVEVLSNKLVKDFGEFDPKLELSNYKFPTLELLKEYNSNTGITIDQEELEQNKNTIVETLRNYKIEIDQIKATVGPTVTLYEIIPEAGIRISKIKNLEDDIALSLSALGIRIIAPIPGKGTIGIEVPNKNPKMVSMRSVIASPRFQNAEMELPLALGKTISNETFVVDLAKMPHLLMAGATGQGKSVGLNAILTSLLYKKHPAEVKFVLVDPKKVELTLFNKIERHYLAKLPDTDDAIITDNSKVINTLNSLCIEMDQRYDLLKDAMVRNIAEYNAKFKARKLNPNEGHKFLPYIVLVVDEFADLIMTAGKEVETPIARLAQLARAIGIHLIIATQRPSVNVITGIIKANFPARIAFRVTSKIDSRTILDNSGADQLIGRGDMLFTQGNELTRLQCAFVDTPEVDQITNYIGSQRAYASAHILPEYSSEDGGTNLDIGIDERDAMFREAAEVLVIAQQGSASLLQRKLKLGYNRAGRIIDQLEAAGIVGPFEGSKARQVLVPTIDALNHLLDNETQ
ncbi:MAG: DNA translocase FtsK [Flavobacteriaceae bacterium]|nr:DNA translocase FtsK [Flavobacteriaceae bacterium]